MAVRKVKETETSEVQVQVEVPETLETPEVQEPVGEVDKEPVPVQEPEVVATPVVEVEVPEAKVPEVEIDEKSTKVAPKKGGLVKICMRVDHRCTIAMECYDLKAGKVYNVPENVKRILNKAGLLAPLP